MRPERRAALADIVLRGALAGGGMPNFGELLDEADLASILAYLSERARPLREAAER